MVNVRKKLLALLSAAALAACASSAAFAEGFGVYEWSAAGTAMGEAYMFGEEDPSVLAYNPAADIRLPKVRKTLPSFVRPEEMQRLLEDGFDETKSDFIALRDRLIVEMLYQTGIRRAELVSLTDAAVDNRICEIKVRGKRDKERIVPYGAMLGDMIAAYRRLRDGEVGKTDAFFVRENGEPLYPGLVYRVVRRALDGEVTLRKRSPHVLRHSFASAMLNNGAGINSVKELLGHSSLASTEVYTHITFAELKQYYKQAHPRALKKGGHYGS